MKKNRQILVLAALLFGFLCFPADKVLAASNVVEVPLTVKQNFEENSNEKGIDLTGTYEFRALDIGIPMPGDSDNDRHVFVLDGNNAEKMISLQFQHGGVYRYHLVQTSKDKENYTYDSKTYDVTIEGFFDSNNELMAVTVVKNENGDKVSKVSFKNSYTGQTGKNQTPVPSSTGPKDIIHNGSPVKTGDDSPVAGYLFLFFGSVICLCGLLMEKQKNRKEDAKNEA